MMIIFVPDPFNILDLFNIRKKSLSLTVFDNINRRVFPYIRKIDKFVKAGRIDINFVIYSVTID